MAISRPYHSDSEGAPGIGAVYPVESDSVKFLTRVTVDSLYPFMLSLGQEETECILTERSARLGVTVERGHELLGIEAPDQTVPALVQNREGTPSTISADRLTGCDGGESGGTGDHEPAARGIRLPRQQAAGAPQAWRMIKPTAHGGQLY